MNVSCGSGLPISSNLRLIARTYRQLVEARREKARYVIGL